MKVMLTGSSGFIGKQLLGSLRAKAIEVLKVSRQEGIDLTVDSLDSFELVDMVVHLAANSYVPRAFDDPCAMYRDNYLSTLNVLEYCRMRGVKKMLHISSYVYGEPEYLPVDEEHSLNIKNPYGRSKLFCEQLCRAYYEDYGVNVVVLRPFNLYGCGQNGAFLFPTIANQLIDESKNIIELNSLSPKRDYMYIKDFAELLARVVTEVNFSGFEFFNVGSGTSHCVAEIVEIFQEELGLAKEVIVNKQPRKNEILDCYASVKKLREIIDWIPQYDLRMGVQDMLKDMRANRDVR